MYFGREGASLVEIGSLDVLADYKLQRVEPLFPGSRHRFIFLEKGPNDVYRLDDSDYKALKHKHTEQGTANPKVDS